MQSPVTSLSAGTIAVIKATVPALSEHAQTITAKMYERLFQDEHIHALFNQANQKNGMQVHALAGAILAYARNIENLGALTPVVERVAQKHLGFHILPEHYPYVAIALLGAIEDVLGDAATQEILQAWTEAYWLLAGVLQTREAVLRKDIEHADGGWNGWRQFVVADKIAESEVITSFILRPVDGKPVLHHRPGQYLTFRFDAPGQPGLKRNYSISCGPNGKYYRISVKLEPASQGGSRFLHNGVHVGTVLEATPPAGDFYLPSTPQRPVVLLSGGVGLTPMVSMIETISRQYPGLETHYVHGTLNSATHAMGDHVRLLAKEHGRISVSTFYSAPVAEDVPGETYDVSGFISTDWLEGNTPLREADFYLCGPKPFLRAFVSGLTLKGVPPDRIHYEIFGPADELIAA